MKWLFFIFVLANLLVFGLIRLGGDSQAIDPRSREIHADAMRIVTGQLASLPKPAPASQTAAEPETKPALVIASQPAEVPQKTNPDLSAEKLVCLRWSGFSVARASSARARLNALGLTATESGGAENAKAWVYIPPQENPELARKKAQEVADLGVEDYFVVNDGSKWQNAVSLGIFSTREAGERRLAELRAKGVRSAIVRDKDDTLKPVTFLLKNVSADARQKLEKTSAQFRGVELRETSCR